MNKQKDDHVEKLIRDALLEELDNSPKPPKSKEETWEHIIKKTQRNSRVPEKRILNKQKWMYVASLFVLVSTITLFSSGRGLAFGSMTEVIQKIQGTVMHLFVKVDRGGDEIVNHLPETGDVNVEGEDEVMSLNMSVEKAQEQTGFPIVIPDYIPSEYELKDVTVVRIGKQLSEEIILNYEGGKEGFAIQQMMVDHSTGFGLTLEQEKASTRGININGSQANILHYDHDETEIVWVTENDLYYSIIGHLTDQELMDIAKSM